MAAPRLCRPLPLAALAVMLLAGTAGAGRPLSPAAESKGPSTEPRVTAQDGPQPFAAGAAAGATTAANAGGGAAASAGGATAAGSPGTATAGGTSTAAATRAAAAASAAAGAGSAAAALPTPAWLPSGVFSGDGTAYSEAVDGTGANFACSYRYLNPYFSTNFVAINKAMWDNGNACGKCITAWCVDDRCPVKGKKVTAQVVDLCPECKEGDVDFSIPMYRDVTGSWPNRLSVSWQWTDCSDMVQGDIMITPKDGINPQWQAFYFANAKYPLQAVRLNGQDLQRSEFQFWVHAAPLSTPATFEFQAVNGATVSATVNDPLGKNVTGIKLVLNPSQPKLTVLGLTAACPDGSSGCAGQFLMQAVQDVYEVDAAGSRVTNRGASDVLNLSQGSWALNESADLSEQTSPAVNASVAAFTAPFKSSFPACSPGATFPQPLPSSGHFTFTVLLFPADTNYTAAPGLEAAEVLEGNVKTTVDIAHWPFCSADHQLVLELALKSTKLGAADAPRAPSVRNGTEAQQAADELAQDVYSAVGAEPEEGDSDAAPSWRHPLQGQAGQGKGQGGNDASGGSSGKPRTSRFDALAQLPGTGMNETSRSALFDKVAKRRPVAGLGRPSSPGRLFLALPGAGAIDSKVDVPSSALIDGTATNISVAAPAFQHGEGLQRVVLTFPSFAQGLLYDPTTAFATSDGALDQQLSAAALAASSGAAAARCRGAAGLLALLGAAAAAVLLL
ncbi:hypothetical protein ABPG75_007340 [Micractinium tetrahymenae]